MNRIRSLLLLAALAAGVSVGCSRHYRAHTPPPPPPPYAYRERGMAPGPGYVWVDGYWAFRGNHWHWMSGHWVRQPYSRRGRR
ncbi:MAG: hypothetical protein Q8N47_08410 [Bryobacterales bacterium]|nr:hypothetical protein [Bryobacterales bacterium]